MSAREYFIEFDTKDMPGKLIATRVTIDRVILPANDRKLNIALAEDPLYPKLQTYVKSNPR